MPAINVFITDPTESRISFLKEHADAIGCITLPYGSCPSGLETFPQAVLLSGNDVPADLLGKHPMAGAVFSYTPVSCDLPNILCNNEGTYICLCLDPPDAKHFSPPGLTEEWVQTVQRAIRQRDPETVTVELCAGAYAVPFPYNGNYRALSVSEALSIARQHGAVLNVNKNSYYSYFIYSESYCPHAVFLSSTNHLSRMLQRFSKLGIKRFAVSNAELADREMRGLLSFFKKCP